MKLVFEILSFWQVGTGEGLLGGADSRAARDCDGLPYIPGRQVKGLCRDAVLRTETFGKITAGMSDALFGSRAAAGGPLLSDPSAGCLRFGSARLPKSDRNALRGQSALIAELFQIRRSTAISDQGTALAGTLRSDEIVIPLTLEAPVSPLEGAPESWRDELETALPLLNGIGSGRSRGLGRVIVTLAEDGRS